VKNAGAYSVLEKEKQVHLSKLQTAEEVAQRGFGRTQHYEKKAA